MSPFFLFLTRHLSAPFAAGRLMVKEGRVPRSSDSLARVPFSKCSPLFQSGVMRALVCVCALFVKKLPPPMYYSGCELS